MALHDLFTMRGLPPHGYCLLWDPLLVGIHVVSDAIIGLSYFSIPVVLTVLLIRRRDIEFGWLVVLFAVFIMACGTTHFMSILVLWVPAYGIEGLIKALTAAASVGTAITMWPLLPKLIALPSPTQLQRVNDELRVHAEERARIENQLVQSQKLEAVGRLTGGIAHDFNNLLTVIMGNVDRAARTFDDPARATNALKNAMEAAKRAALLTDQLLTFGRKRVMQVDRLDLNDLLRQLENLITSTVGDPVVVSMALADQPLPIEFDKTQFEMAVLNLAANARDAMPAGGTLTFETLLSHSGQPTLIVRDTGCGMDITTIERATEPFFTTKPVGQGTGLGLSQVYGFVTQAGGTMLITSEVGSGTSATVTFPMGSPD